MKKLTILLLSIAASMLFTITAFAGTWKQDATGWWWDNGNGTYPSNCWQWCDGNNDGISECYYFNEKGYCLQNCTTPDGYQVNEDGAWVLNGKVQTQKTSTVNTASEDNIKIEGKYTLYAICSSSGTAFLASDLGASGYINLKSDGTAKWSMGKGYTTMDWYNDGNTLYLEQDSTELEGNIYEGVIELYISGGVYYYAKANADTSWIGATTTSQYARSLHR